MPLTSRIRSQVLFVDHEDGRVVLDGVLTESAGPTSPAGTPITLVVRAPDSALAARVLPRTLARWVDSGLPVEIELVGLGERVVLSDGSATFRLALEAAS